MAVEWRLESKGEKVGAARVCARVYETLNDLVEEVQEGRYEGDTPLAILDELCDRFMKALPFDPEDL